ncbi:Bromo adjacent homology (BAH) domain [Macleaya cordata]|uniref:Bromo adjacent homology (BAH) domain n=1 Tax=Macleaya cordata TaxID=56857 RepID=A0A200PTB1_MACCD|nr:Bromo adjacent homology (BAH) domain [Macleaya cordata]
MKMEITTTTSTNSSSMSSLFVDWEEVLVSNEKGRREVHYYLKRKDGSGRDLVVIGKERTLRHMSYSYALTNPPLLKLRSRREVLDWLSSIVSDTAAQAVGGSLACDDALNSKVPALKELQMKGYHSKDFLWLGSPWTCRKRRRHYQSFCRNGITVSIHDFIYVLAEENKRLIAYLEDLYEDSRGNKMVVVRWFHKIDEVGIVLPPDFNDREIFFSLCLQDLSVECIDGLATVLSPQHFEKLRKEAKDTQWEPFMCHRQFDNDVITSFDVTQVQGYWKQESLRYSYTTSHRRHLKSDIPSRSLEVGDDDDDSIKTRPRKKHCRSKSRDLDLHLIDKKRVKESVHVDIQKHSNDLVVSSSGAEICCPKEGNATACLSRKGIDEQTPSPHVDVGCHVEVLSQDSGIRGCWFRVVVVKKHKNKVKVRYQDIKDAVDEAKNLEEWVLASKIAVPDKLGLRLCGRTTVRPHPPTNILLGLVEVGTPVDAWWHDGWWEGIVVRKESDERVHVYFPEEGRLSIFGRRDLRCSQDWLSNKWNRIKERPDLVISILSEPDKTRQNGVESSSGGSNSVHIMISDSSQRDHFSPKDEKASCTPSSKPPQDERVKSVDGFVPNLGRDDFLAQLRWNSSSKKRRSRERLRRRHEDLVSKQPPPSNVSSSSSPEKMESQIASEIFLMPKSLKVDLENCKYRGDSVLKSSVCPLTSLVMSQ